ncbi:MAG: type 4a pilus biogenesis protein PilO [Nitrospinae bacterium]|nr:type 4a pilus biogenesis protein PilO [Nitrospinota bacterium]
MNISNREKIVLGAGITAVLSIGLYTYIVKPVHAGRIRIKSEIERKVEFIDRYNEVLKNKNIMDNRVKEMEKKGQQMVSYLLSGNTPPLAAAELQNILQGAGGELGLTIESAKVLDHKKVDIFYQIPVEISMKTEMRKLRDFIYKIENSPKFLTIPKVRMRVIRNNIQYEPEIIEARIETAGYILRAENVKEQKHD